MRTRIVLHALCRSFLSLAVLIDRGASEHKRRRTKGTRLSRNGKPVTTLKGITWETSDTTRVSTTRRKAQNGQDDSSSVGCSPESFLRLAKAEVRGTDFPSPSQLSVPFAEVETAGSPPVGGVSPRCREQETTGLPCISYSGKTKLVLRERALSGRFLSLFAIEFISRLSFSVFVCHRCCHIAFLGRDVCCSLFCVGAGCLVRFSSWFVCSVLRECVSSGHFLYLGLPPMSYCLSPAWHDFIGGAWRLNQSINQSTLPVIFLLECSVDPPPAGDLRFVRNRQKTCACTRLRGSRKPSSKNVVERAETTRDSLLKPFPCVPVQIYMPRAEHFYLWRY